MTLWDLLDKHADSIGGFIMLLVFLAICLLAP